MEIVFHLPLFIISHFGNIAISLERDASLEGSHFLCLQMQVEAEVKKQPIPWEPQYKKNM